MSKSANTVIFYFLLVWLAINLVQSAFSELHYDEAYYWVYSRFLDWGYYDHPPMVALFIKAGTLLTQSPLGTRLLSVISNVIAVLMLWKIAKNYADNARLFVLLYSSMLILHVYSFITTPDTPLFFFTVLFYYVLRRYLSDDRPKYAVLLALVIACMLYSKYHALLIILFTVLGHWKLLKRPSFWLIAALAIVFFLPHILWQVNNDFPSLFYHLLDRTSQVYRFSFISDFILGQLLIVGPLTGVFLYYYVYKQKTTDTFLRILKFNCFGFLLFFLLSAFNSRVQAHWTLLAFIPFFILAYTYLAGMPALPPWFRRLSYANIALILLVRVLLIVPVPALSTIKGLKQFWGKEQFAEQLHRIVGDDRLIMDNGFQDISYYNFMNNTVKGLSYNTRHYRKTQYDYWPIEDSTRNRGAYFASFGRLNVDKQDSLDTERGRLYFAYIDSVRTYQKVTIAVKGVKEQAAAGERQAVTLEIYNPYGDTISFSNEQQKWACFIEYGFIKHFFEHVDYNAISGDYHQLRIAPGESASLATHIRMPDVPGDYALVFSIRTAPFAGSRNSKKIPVTITTTN
ncbi:Dolichyl-phosphate-mannose-protein mannosyltransferase [Parapedobacter luteus]|uniref:Dolichyl-phosphate-mannose-protein mannosyltransferase n=1 Tax=Parapedobacter luteus TaxID=623280 RepID=A0A1T5EYS6_9SPHI|nr:glycosyltransferase family 39 protein [Parapedobacter luteus]SKB88850.1 Dolichyl-phosphate-mannose-protein mannosyltransferase [Parapedobacter luteus]